jgi:hypothetical protein
MRRIVLVSNASGEIKESLERYRGSFLDPADTLISFRELSVDSISSKIFSAYLSKSPADDYDTCVVVFVVNGSDGSLDDLRLQFPGVVFLKAPFRFERAHRKQYFQFISFLQRELVHARKLFAALRREVKERDSRTPLLLPVRNFNSPILDELIVEVQKLRPKEKDYDLPLRALIGSKGLLPVRQVVAGRAKTYFENRNAIRFYGPSKAGPRHGLPSYKAPHNFGCLVNAYFRLGVRYDAAFHYDCQYANRHIGGRFPNCHSEEQACSLNTHINISPNDFIR